MDNRHRDIERWSQKIAVYRRLRTALIAWRSALRQFPAKEVLGRWATVLCYGALAAAGLALGWPWAVASLPGHLKGLGWGWWAVIPLAIVALISFARGLPHLWRNRFGTRSFWRYPPAWSGAPFGVALLLWFWVLVPAARATIPNVAPSDAVALAQWASYSTLTLWLGLGAASIRKRRSRRDWQAPQISGKCDLTSDFSELSQWLRNDNPISVPSNDAFGHHAIARRIATRVVEDPGTTVALLGALGAGKSSVAKLVDHELTTARAGSQVQLVSISIWSYKTQEAAIHGILDALLEALSLHVSTLPLQGLPTHYLDLLEQAGDVPSRAARLFRTNKSPDSLLKDFDAVARAVDRRFVLWVEDDERFVRTTDVSTAAHDPIGLIRSALHLLDACSNISVLLASGTSREQFDFEKVARYVEQLPRLEPAAVFLVLETFTRGCFDGQPFIYIGRKLRELMPTRASADADGEDLEEMLLGDHPRGMARTLCELCATPRVLKQALRACLEKWEVLRGEIDFEDLLSMSVLREAEPAAFDLVTNHIDDLRATRRHMGEDPARDFWAALDQTYKERQARLEPVKALINFVFVRENPIAKPQGLALSGHRDYWSRFMSVPELAHGERDQPILQAARENDLADLARRLAAREGSRAAELLAGRAAAIDLPALLEVVIEQRCSEDPSGWGDRVPGIMPVWRMMLPRNQPDPPVQATALHATLLRGLASAVPVSLVLVDEIMRYFTTTESEVESLLRDGERDLSSDINAHLHQVLPVAFEGAPEKLAQALRGRRHDALYYLAWTRDRVRARQLSGLPFSEWNKFASTLLESAAVQPAVALPQIARFIVQQNERARGEAGEEYSYDAELAARLFGSSQDVLTTFLEHGQGLSTDWGPLATVMEATQAVARQIPAGTGDENV